jgi:hypothetical protein
LTSGFQKMDISKTVLFWQTLKFSRLIRIT